ncbi:MAG: hypothetical protein WAV13_04650, partial [Thermodesulfovibrionales bacterium]
MPFGTKVEVDEELQGCLRELVKDFDEEDTTIRENQVRLWKKLEEYWDGFQMIFWSDRDQSWISPESVRFEDVFSDEEVAQLGPIYDYVVDIYKAHGESIIAALSSTIPTLRYRPDDADSEADRLTARTFSKIADLLYVHNKAKLLFLRAMYYIYNAGNVFSYRYVESSPKFGTFKIPKVGTEEVTVCPICEYVREANELAPCPNCGSDVAPIVKTQPSE